MSSSRITHFMSAVLTLQFLLIIGSVSAISELPDGIESVLGFRPRTTFKCSKDGYFGDVDNECRIFHVCQSFKQPNGRTEWQQWTYACGNQTMFNQLTLTCAFIDEAVPCQHAPQFQYLNEVIHRPKEPFLTDADVTSGISYYNSRVMSESARLRADTSTSESPINAEDTDDRALNSIVSEPNVNERRIQTSASLVPEERRTLISNNGNVAIVRVIASTQSPQFLATQAQQSTITPAVMMARNSGRGFDFSLATNHMSTNLPTSRPVLRRVVVQRAGQSPQQMPIQLVPNFGAIPPPAPTITTTTTQSPTATDVSSSVTPATITTTTRSVPTTTNDQTSSLTTTTDNSLLVTTSPARSASPRFGPRPVTRAAETPASPVLNENRQPQQVNLGREILRQTRQQQLSQLQQQQQQQQRQQQPQQQQQQPQQQQPQQQQQQQQRQQQPQQQPQQQQQQQQQRQQQPQQQPRFNVQRLSPDLPAQFVMSVPLPEPQSSIVMRRPQFQSTRVQTVRRQVPSFQPQPTGSILSGNQANTIQPQRGPQPAGAILTGGGSQSAFNPFPQSFGGPQATGAQFGAQNQAQPNFWNPRTPNLSNSSPNMWRTSNAPMPTAPQLTIG